MTIYFDLDGVLRDLEKKVWGKEVEYYDEKIPNWDRSTSEFFLEHPQVFLDALPTKYLNIPKKIISSGKKVNILTAAVGINPNVEWCNKYLGKGNYDITFVSSPMEKLSYLDSFDVLIDDYPYVQAEKDNRIWIINRHCNKHIQAIRRIYNEKNLENLLINVGINFDHNKISEQDVIKSTLIIIN